LLRVRGRSVTTVLRLSDERSFVRQSTIGWDRDGVLWVGEYGVFPGARCAHLYRSLDGGARFSTVASFERARHLHLVKPLADGRVAVTTGDLANEQRLYLLGPNGRRVPALASMSGFTACVESGDRLVFGSDLLEGNGLVRLDPRLRRAPEVFPLSGAVDLQCRTLLRTDEGRLFALLSLDADLRAADRVRDRRPALLSSVDDGRDWTLEHVFAADGADAPESLIALPGDAGFLTTISTGGGAWPSSSTLLTPVESAPAFSDVQAHRRERSGSAAGVDR